MIHVVVWRLGLNVVSVNTQGSGILDRARTRKHHWPRRVRRRRIERYHLVGLSLGRQWQLEGLYRVDRLGNSGENLAGTISLLSLVLLLKVPVTD